MENIFVADSMGISSVVFTQLFQKLRQKNVKPTIRTECSIK